MNEIKLYEIFSFFSPSFCESVDSNFFSKNFIASFGFSKRVKASAEYK